MKIEIGIKKVPPPQFSKLNTHFNLWLDTKKKIFSLNEGVKYFPFGFITILWEWGNVNHIAGPATKIIWFYKWQIFPTKREIKEGEMIPKWYGCAYLKDYSYNYIYYPIPFNFIARYLFILKWKLKKPNLKKILQEEILETVESRKYFLEKNKELDDKLKHIDKYYNFNGELK